MLGAVLAVLLSNFSAGLSSGFFGESHPLLPFSPGVGDFLPHPESLLCSLSSVILVLRGGDLRGGVDLLF